MKSIPLATASVPLERLSRSLLGHARQPRSIEQVRLPAITAMSFFATYDGLRLRIYRERGPRGDRFNSAQFGPALALRSEEIGYFNRVYAPDHTIAESLTDIEAFYASSPFGCQLIGPPTSRADGISRACSRRGWSHGARYAWLEGQPTSSIPMTEHSGLEVRSPTADEHELFLHTYLTAFEAKPHGFSAAIQNMCHLFEMKDIIPLLAFRDGEPAAVGVLFRVGTVAILCAGATVPRHRQQGCHRVLLATRLRLAAELGCERIYSWAEAGSQSHVNMEHAGLRTVGITQAWRMRGAST